MLLSSRQNSLFKMWMSLHESRGIKKEQMFLLMGSKLVTEFLKDPKLKILFELRTPDQESVLKKDELESYLKKNPFPKSYELSSILFNELDNLGTHSNILVLELPHLKNWSPEERPDGLEVIIPLGDPANLGALIRSCQAFGVKKIILSSESAHPFLPKSIKASSGAVLNSPIFWGPSLIQIKEFSSTETSLIFLDMNGKSIRYFKWPRDCRLFLGQEGPGIGFIPYQNNDLNEKSAQSLREINRTNLDSRKPSSSLHHIRIETQGVESLNATVAASIALFSYSMEHGVNELPVSGRAVE